jgi:hypothetical protein
MLKAEDTNSVCSDEELTNETVVIKEKTEEDKEDKEDDDEDDDDDEDEDDDDDDDEDENKDKDEEEEEEEEDDEDADEDEDNEFDTTIIQFEMMKNFFVDKDGDNISTHLGSISHELRKLNKIAVKLLEKK